MHHVLWVFPDKAVVQRTAANLVLSSVLPVQESEYHRPPDVDVVTFLERIVSRLPAGRGDKWHIGLPLEYFFLVNFSLPQAAADNLDQAVKYALMRHVPFDLSTTYMDYSLVGSDGQVDIAAVVAQKEEIDPILHLLAQSRLTVRSIFPSLVQWSILAGDDGAYLLHSRGQTEIVVAQGGQISFHLWFRPSEQEGEEAVTQRGATLLENIPDHPKTLYIIGRDAFELQGLQSLQSSFARSEEMTRLPTPSVRALSESPYAISLLSPAVRKQEKMSRYLQISALVFVLLCLLAFPTADLLGTMRYRDQLQDKIESVQHQVKELEEIRSENQELENFFEALAQKVQTQPRAALILQEMTEVIPETAWLYSFHFAERKARIQGEADSATAVLEALENSPIFENVEYDSPVQKSGSRDRFQILAQVSL
ncbi:MAG: PilN domain-containing protein [Desulfovermiculus sp.]|nr:PilN domain-containing protein [Desulfovermiculus sp.]